MPAMRVKVLAFASLAQRLGEREMVVELPDGATVADALADVESRHTALREARVGLSTAVNLAYVRADHVLRDGDELALIPPVSGG